MGEFNAAKWFTIITLYFILFIGIVTATESFIGSTNSSNATGGADLDTLEVVDQQYCDVPRVAFTPSGNQLLVTGQVFTCDTSIGAASETRCNAIQGCEWKNVTSGFWIFASTSAKCTGEINESHYGINDLNNVCAGSNVENNLDNCRELACTVYDAEVGNKFTNPKSFLDIVGGLFTFSYDFGFTGLTNTFITIFTVFLPLLLWILSIYYMIPIIH